MNRFWNSLQFRLFTTFGIIIVLVLMFVVLTGQARQLADERKHQSIAADDLSRNAYVIMTLFHKYIDVTTDNERSEPVFVWKYSVILDTL